jgi:predicted N-acetyltransferase YhbS
MSDISLTILAETANDALPVERLHERTFGPGRFVLSAYRLREHVDHRLDLSFTARIGTLLVGSVRQLPVCIGDTPALLLGPLTVEPPFRGRGVGRALLDRALKDAKAKGHRLVLLVGDEAYYGRVGFKVIPRCPVRWTTSGCWSPNWLTARSQMSPARSGRTGVSRGSVAQVAAVHSRI